MKHLDNKDMTFYLDQELSRSRTEEVDIHIKECGSCNESVQELRQILDSLQEYEPALEEIDLVDSVMNTISNEIENQTAKKLPIPKSIWSTKTAAFALALAACFIAVFIQPDPKEEIDQEFRIRSTAQTPNNTLTGVSVYRVSTGQAPEYLSKHMSSQDSLLFAYSNAGNHIYKYLMVVGVDYTGNSHWYYPAWTDSKQNPTSISIQSGETGEALREAIQHDIPNGPYTLYAIFTDSPLKVSIVEKQLEHLLKTDNWAPGQKLSLPNIDATIQVIGSEVK
jgi:hypothetical protein